jgi:hypothetical protein
MIYLSVELLSWSSLKIWTHRSITKSCDTEVMDEYFKCSFTSRLVYRTFGAAMEPKVPQSSNRVFKLDVLASTYRYSSDTGAFLALAGSIELGFAPKSGFGSSTTWRLSSKFHFQI